MNERILSANEQVVSVIFIRGLIFDGLLSTAFIKSEVGSISNCGSMEGSGFWVKLGAWRWLWVKFIPYLEGESYLSPAQTMTYLAWVRLAVWPNLYGEIPRTGIVFIQEQGLAAFEFFSAKKDFNFTYYRFRWIWTHIYWAEATGERGFRYYWQRWKM